MKKVLWISRHVLSEAQTAGLKRFCGCAPAVHWWQENVEDIRALIPAAREADVIAAVLPIHLLAELVALFPEKPVLIAMARRTLIATDGPEAETRFTHGGWQRIRRLELELEPLE